LSTAYLKYLVYYLISSWIRDRIIMPINNVYDVNILKFEDLITINCNCNCISMIILWNKCIRLQITNIIVSKNNYLFVWDMFFIYSSVNIFPYGRNKCKLFGWVVPKVYIIRIYIYIYIYIKWSAIWDFLWLWLFFFFFCRNIVCNISPYKP
jgi:hypothetical protein